MFRPFLLRVLLLPIFLRLMLVSLLSSRVPRLLLESRARVRLLQLCLQVVLELLQRAILRQM